jgi:hypothetical protein
LKVNRRFGEIGLHLRGRRIVPAKETRVKQVASKLLNILDDQIWKDLKQLAHNAQRDPLHSLEVLQQDLNVRRLVSISDQPSINGKDDFKP